METSESLKLKKPNLFIVGAPKCGTTAMYHYLKSHCDVYLARKEPHYFCTDLTIHFPIDLRYKDDYEYVVKNFAKRKAEKISGEASVWYLFSKVAAEKIHHFSPDAKIIIMLRNPIEMLHSLHSQLIMEGIESLYSFADALAAIERRKKKIDLPQIDQDGIFGPVEALYYMDVLKYAEQIERYYVAFGRENVLTIIYDDFCSDPKGIYLKTLDFLELEPCEPLPNFKRINANRKVRSAALWRFRHFSPLWLRALWRVLLPASVRSKVLNLILQLNTYETRREPINAELRAQLRHKLRPEVERLSILLGRDLAHWVKE